LASWRQPVITGRNRQEATMHPTVQYNLMQARHHDMMQAAAQKRLAAQAGAARRAHRDSAEAPPRRRMLRLVWRPRPA
jgi:hypothetical protein